MVINEKSVTQGNVEYGLIEVATRLFVGILYTTIDVKTALQWHTSKRSKEKEHEREREGAREK